MGASEEGEPRDEPAPPASGPRRSRRRNVLAVGAVAGVIAAVAIGARLATPEAPPVEDPKLLAALIEEMGRGLAACTWERPVLRGAPIPGDGTKAHEAAIYAFAIQRKDAGYEHLDTDLPADAAAELLVLGDALEDVRLALQYESFPNVWAGEYRAPLHTHHTIDALLLEAARSAPSAGACLELVADRIRFDQDHMLGDGTPTHVRMEEASQVALACAARATDAELAAASWEMRELATRWPPVLRELQRQALDDIMPKDPSRASYVDEESFFDRFGTGPARRRAGREAVARSIARARAFRDAEGLGHAELQALAMKHYVEWGGEISRAADLSNHARAEVQIKQLALALGWLEGAWHPPDLPDDAIAIDPYTGRPLRATVEGDGIAILSLGEDGEPDTKSRADDIVLTVRPRGADHAGASDRDGAARPGAP